MQNIATRGGQVQFTVYGIQDPNHVAVTRIPYTHLDVLCCTYPAVSHIPVTLRHLRMRACVTYLDLDLMQMVGEVTITDCRGSIRGTIGPEMTVRLTRFRGKIDLGNAEGRLFIDGDLYLGEN